LGGRHPRRASARPRRAWTRPCLNEQHAVFAEAVSKGITLFASSGDSGASQAELRTATGALFAASTPASDPKRDRRRRYHAQPPPRAPVRTQSETAWTEPFGCKPAGGGAPADVKLQRRWVQQRLRAARTTSPRCRRNRGPGRPGCRLQRRASPAAWLIFSATNQRGLRAPGERAGILHHRRHERRLTPSGPVWPRTADQLRRATGWATSTPRCTRSRRPKKPYAAALHGHHQPAANDVAEIGGGFKRRHPPGIQ